MKAAREKAKEKKDAAVAKAARRAQTAEASQSIPAEDELAGEAAVQDSAALKRKHEEIEGSDPLSTEDATDASKKNKVNDPEEASTTAKQSEAAQNDTAVDVEAGQLDEAADSEEAGEIGANWTEPETTIQNIVITKPSYEMRGHTSYLTFALYYPATIRQQLDAQDTLPKSGAQTPVSKRLEQVAATEREERSGSQETDYVDEALDKAMGTLTEEDMMAMGA